VADIVMFGITLVFFALSFAMVRWFDQV